MKATSSRATTRSRAVRGAPKAYQSSAASMVGSRQIRDRSSHLRGMPRVPGVSGTISNAQLQRQARCDAQAHRARECGLWHRAAGGLACTHLQRTLSVPLRLQGSSQAGRYYRQPSGEQKVLNFEELHCSTTCSASKTSSVAEVRGELARAAPARTAHGHYVGAVHPSRL